MEMTTSYIPRLSVKPLVQVIPKITCLVIAASCIFVSACHPSSRGLNSSNAMEIACVIGRPILSTDVQPSEVNNVQTLQSAVRCFVNPLLDHQAKRTFRWPSFDEVTNMITCLEQKRMADVSNLETRRTAVIVEIELTSDTGEKSNSLADELNALNMALHILKSCTVSTNDFECAAQYLARMHMSQDLYREYGGSVLIINPVNYCEGPLPEIIPLTAYRYFLLEAIENGLVTFNAPVFKEQISSIFEQKYDSRFLNQNEVIRWLDVGFHALSDFTTQ